MEKSKVQEKVIKSNNKKKYLNYYTHIPRFFREFLGIGKGDVLEWNEYQKGKVLITKSKNEVTKIN